MQFLNLIFITLTYCIGLSLAESASSSDSLARRDADQHAVDNNDNDQGSTTYNGVEVPAMLMLNGENLADEIKTGYWLVEFFSPYCHHCKMMAPEWQALYEIYYTSNPLPLTQQAPDDDQAVSSTSLNSFTRYYSLKFGKVDCVAFGTACGNADIKAFPTVVLFKDGEEVKRMKGTHNLKELSEWLEERLESIKPGSRSQGGPRLPIGENGKFDESQIPRPGSTDKSTIEDNSQDGLSSATSLPSTAKDSDDSPNAEGLSVRLSRESFRSLVTSTLEPWFIKFYAPWCPHCQKMAPNWAEMAKEMKGILNIGEVNCDADGHLCRDLHARSYPTILFFRGGERIEYDGLRGVGDLLSFATKAVDVGSGVRDVDLTAFEKLEESEEVIFLYLYDRAATKEDFAALDRLTLSLVGHARLVKTNDPDMYKRFQISTWPSLIVSREGKTSRYDGLSPNDMRNVHQILSWMKSVWQPIVPELTGSNARELMSNNIVVLGILSRDRSDEFIDAKREIKNAAFEWMDREASAFTLERDELRNAKQLRIDEADDRNDQRALRAAKLIRLNMDDLKRKKVAFAWVDGVFWQRWVRTTYGIDVTTDGERVIINDEQNRLYWENTITGNPIVPSRTSILETLPKIVSNPPQLQPKSSASSLEHIFLRLHSIYVAHPIILMACAILISFAFAIWGKGVIGRNRRRGGVNLGFGFGGGEKTNGVATMGGGAPGYFHLDGKDSLIGNGATNTNGKVD